MAGWIGTKSAAAILVATIIGGSSLAQSVAHFLPGPAAPGGGLALRVVVESPAGREALPWPARDPARDIGWLYVREEGTQRNYDALAPDAADPTLLCLERETSGAILLGWDRPARIEELRSDELRAFLGARSKGQPPPQAIEELLARETLPVRRLESLSRIEPGTASGGAPEPSAVSTSKSGQRMEVRAMLDPTVASAGNDFAFRLYCPTGPAADAILVRAVHLASGEVADVHLRPDLQMHVRLDRAGAWMIEACALRRADEATDAVLELATSTLVLDVRESPARAQQGGGR